MRRLLLVVVLLASTMFASPASALPGDPLVLGAAQPANNGLTAQQAVQRLESSLGRPLAAVRIYDKWNTAFPTPYITWLKSTGHALVLSVKASRTNGTPILWRDIATAGPADPLYDDIVRWAHSVSDYGLHVYFIFNHEPENTGNAGSGTATDFIDAWRNVVTVMRANGATNAEFVWTTSGGTYAVPTTDKRYAPSFYPGDAFVDDIGADVYNMYCLRRDGRYQQPWKSLQERMAPMMTFAQDHPTVGLMLPEFAGPEDAAVPGRKADWLSEARALFQQPGYERFKAILYWNEKSPKVNGCDFRVTSSTSSFDAFKAMANDPYYTASAP